LIFSLVVFLCQESLAQDTLLYETFQSQLLGEWASTDIDGLPLAPDFIGLAGGYQVLGVSGPNDLRAVAVSAFEGGGTADNWLISPAIELTKAATKLKWRGTSLSGDPLLGEDYRVMLSRGSGIVSDFSDILAIVTNESFTGTDREFDLSAYTGQTVHIAFQHTSTDKYALTIDDILIVEPSAENDAKITAINGERYQCAGDLGLTLEVFNSGSSTITDLDIETHFNTTSGTIELRLQNIKPQESLSVPLGEFYPFASRKYNIDANITMVNGVALDPLVVARDFYIIDSLAPARDFLVEEATSTTCGWCPSGIVAKHDLEDDFPFSYVGVSVHSSDPMDVPAYNLGLSSQTGFIGVPSASVNRKAFMPMEEVKAYFESNNRLKAPATLDILYDYNSSTRTLSASLSAFAHTDLNADDHRFGFILLEDNVTGSDPDYDQLNFYSADASDLPLIGVDGTNWQDLPASVPASDMVYDDVAREIFGGFDGIQNSITSVSSGSSLLYDINYILPSTIDENQVYMVVFIMDNKTGEIINVYKEEMRFVSDLSEVDLDDKYIVYPNPASQHFSIKTNRNIDAPINVDLFDFAGQHITTYPILNKTDNQQFKLDRSLVKTGGYIIKMTNDSGLETYKKLLIID